MLSGMLSLPVIAIRSVEKRHGVGALGDIARDLVEVKLHNAGVCVGKHEGPRRPG